MSFSNVLSKTRSVFRRKKAAAGPSRDLSTDADNSPGEVFNGNSGYDDASQENESVDTPVFPVDGSILSARSGRDSYERGESLVGIVESSLFYELWRSSFETFEDIETRQHDRRHLRRGGFRRTMYGRQRWSLSRGWNVRRRNRSLFGSGPHPTAAQQIRVLEFIDDLTYEEMLALEEHMGKVIKGLTEEELDSIPTENVCTHDQERLDEEKACSICLEDLLEDEVVRRLRCDHVFHVRCVDSWLRENKTCPVCKVEVVPSVPKEEESQEEGFADGNREVFLDERLENVPPELRLLT
ncbi:hypothetical protein NDN08_002187 [Rhodosorus marinus]|uniref:RING-type E3 ubiquitin transferase n=1 Tax=Rhodosorus marinus TaxID=101924 RepID=A0AAV8UXF6_9RHOD|nr:hypothetical protein NDN08_002187 [Rhodosorus marinus]